MSEHITHIAVYEDSARIILNTSRFCNAFRQSIENNYDAGMITSGSRGNHLFAIPILESYKDQWDAVKADPDTCTQIAGALGWITHRAADLQMKPTWRSKTAMDPSFPDSEMQLYHDSVTFREVYSGGATSTESEYELITPHTFEGRMDSQASARYLDVQKVEELVTFLYQKDFVELHQFHKKHVDVGKWMDDFVEYHQEFVEDLQRFIEAYNNPDPKKMEIYVYGINYYDPEDPLIRWVRGLQYGEDVSGIDLDQALELAKTQSHYAQALLKAYDFLSAANEYFMNRMEKDKVIEILGI